MANDSGENLLLSLGLDLTPIKQAVSDLPKMFDPALKDIKAGLEELGKGLGDSTKKNTDALSKAASEASKVTAELKRSLEATRAKVAEEMKAPTAVRQEASEHTKVTDAIKNQNAELKKKSALIDQNIKKEKEEHGILGKVGEKVVEGVAGSGSLGKILTGAITGSLIAQLVMEIPTIIGGIAESLSEAVKSASVNQVLSVRMGRLAKGQGRNPEEMLSGMSQASEGEVAKPQLQRTAVSMMMNQKTLGQNNEQMDKLYSNYMRVAQASGVDAVRANEMFRVAIEHSQPVLLERVAGLSKVRLATVDLHATTSLVGQDFEEQASKIGVLPTTIGGAIAALKNGFTSLYEGFALGLDNSPGMQAFLHFLEKAGIYLGNLEKTANDFGQKFGNAFYLVQPILTAVWGTIKAIGEAILRLTGLSVITDFISQTGKSTDQWKVAEKFIQIGGAIMTAGYQIQTFIDKLNDIPDIINRLQPVFIAFAHLMGVAFRQGLPGPLGASQEDLTNARQDLYDTVAGKNLQSRKHSGIQMGQIDDSDIARDPLAQKLGFAGKLNQGPTRQPRAPRVNPAPQWMADQLKDLQKQKDNSNGTETTSARRNYGMEARDAREQEEYEKTLAASQRATQLEAIQTNLADKKEALQEEREAEQASYAAGEESAKDHYAALRQFATEQHDFTIQQIKATTQADMTAATADYQAALASISKEADLSGLTAKEVQQKVGIQTNIFQARTSGIQTRYNVQTAGADRTEGAAQAGINLQEKSDQTQAKIRNIENQQTQIETAIRNVQKLNEQAQRQNQISVDEYEERERQAITALTAARMEGAKAVAALQKQSDQAQAEAMGKETDAALKQMQELADLNQATVDRNLAQLGKTYDQHSQILGNQLANQQANPSLGGQAQTLQALQANARQYATQLMAQMPNATPDQFGQIELKLQDINRQMEDWQRQLEDVTSISKILGTALDQMSKSLQGLFTRPGTQKAIGTVASGFEQLAGSNDLRRRISGQTTVQLTPAQQQFDSALTRLATAADKASGALNGMAPDNRSMENQVSGGYRMTSLPGVDNAKIATPTLVGSLFSGISGLFKKKKPVAASYSSGTSDDDYSSSDDGSNEDSATNGDYDSSDSGSSSSSSSGSGGSATDSLGKFSNGLVAAAQGIASFVSTISGSKDAASGAIGGLSSGAGLGGAIGGPIGAGIGAAVGAVMGGIIGQKNKMVQDNIDNAANTFKIIMAQYGENNNNLQATVLALENIITQLQGEKASSKKGGQQYQSAIDQYSQQLQQLEDQQTQIINNLYKQVSVLNAPFGDTDVVSQLQQMLTQYNQFLGAASNAQQLAQANQFLSESIETLENTTSQQVNQDQQQAIQDAISLNDQLYQRYELTKEYNDQVQGILSQGVLTRQQTMAQTKGQQIEDATTQYNQQLQNLNEEISVSQYRVQAEQQIFSLATTRAGLELQLANVQKEAVDYDMTRISALAALGQAFSTGNWQFGPLQDIIQNIGAGMPATSTIGGSTAQQLASVLQTWSSGTSFLNNAVSGAYGNNATSGYGAYRGANL